jgi:hypothetical protein
MRSARQLTLFLTKLRSSRSLKAFFQWYTESYQGEPSGQDGVFKFLRACEYGLPQLFAVVELFAARLRPSTSYALFTAEMPRWFRPEVLKNLDEQGVPVQIAERFYRNGDTLSSLAERLVAVARSRGASLSEFEQRWVLDALVSA